MSRERERTIEVEPPWLQRGRSVVSDVCTRIRHCPGPLADFMLPTHPGRRTSWGRHIGYTLSIPPVSRPPLSEAQENDISILINPRPGPRHCVDRLSSYSHRIALRYLAFPSDPGHFCYLWSATGRHRGAPRALQTIGGVAGQLRAPELHVQHPSSI